MHLTRIGARVRYSRMSLKKFTPQKIIKEKVNKAAIKKVVPVTMVVAESIAPISGRAQSLLKAEPEIFNLSRFELPKFAGVPLKIEENTYPYPLSKLSLDPKNKFNKNSKFLRTEYPGTAEELDYFIEKLIPKKNGTKKNNPFYGKGQAFIDAGKKYNVNPTFLVAIAMQESGRGTSHAAVKKNNIGGIMLNSGHKHFDSVEKCIDDMARIINRRINEHLTTVDAIGHSGKYCARSASSQWIKNVMFYVNQM